jgi:hypothetical protein
VPVLWYPVPINTPVVPFPSPFVLRNWDVREGLPQTQLGTDQSFKTLYFGSKPTSLPGAVCGSADQWANGLLFTDWIAGNYSCACTAGQCGIWSPLCNQIIPNTLKWSLTFSDGQGPFTGTALYDDLPPFSGWKSSGANYDCNGTPIPVSVALRFFPISGLMFPVLAGVNSNIRSTDCGPPPITQGTCLGLITCPNLVGPGPWDATVVFTVN